MSSRQNESIKTTFLHQEYWSLTVQASFSRANVYKKGLEDNSATEKKKVKFKSGLLNHIKELVESQYSKSEVTENSHIQNIQNLIAESEKHADILNDDKGKRITFGVAQKLLNLYLKYLWCAGDLKIAPPHFPVDRMILEEIKFPLREGKFVNWTTLNDEEIYREIIQHFKAYGGCEKARGIESLAAKELIIYKELRVAKH
jgi:hypothetical protein